jgi:hypothetical protein
MTSASGKRSKLGSEDGSAEIRPLETRLLSTLWLMLEHYAILFTSSTRCRSNIYDTRPLMATLAVPSPPRTPSRMPRRWARKCERYCCVGITYFPLVFVYSITTWAVWVEATIGFKPSKSPFIGRSCVERENFAILTAPQARERP